MNQEVEVFVAGRKVKQIAHEGKVFIIAKAGQQYEIKLKNNSTSRVLGVCAVDGRNVIDGESASPTGAGYIVHGYGSYDIKGFRTSNEEVHPFIFDAKEKSYAAKSEDGSPQDCGVIGAVFHAEKYHPPKITVTKEYHHYYPRTPYIYPYRVEPYWSNPQYTCGGVDYGSGVSMSLQGGMQNSGVLRSANVMMNSCSAPLVGEKVADSFDLGTKFSDTSLEDKVVNSEFEIGYELGRIEIYYASREKLVAMGVPVNKANAVVFPQAFKAGFCKSPENNT